MSRPPGLTTTSYAILSLLAVQPWSTYELARQMDRSLGRIWPRAQSKIYEEPKKLVALRLARARKESVGRRSRTVYAITPGGRRALAEWLAEPGAGPVLEFEALVKVIFAEHGSREGALRSLAATRSWAVERNAGNLEAARSYLAGQGPFQQRAPQTMLGGAFLTEFYRMVAEWADWATEIVTQWPEHPAEAKADRTEQARIAERAHW